METSDSEGKWHFLYESLPGGSFAVNNDYIIEDVNNVLCSITGFTREELIGKKCDIICPKGPHYCPMFDLGEERLDNDETSVKTKDNRLVPIIKSARRLPLNNREIIVENFQDITAQKRVEQRLSRLNQALLNLGPDYEDNINRLTEFCGELLGASHALYNQFKDGNLFALGKWKLPGEFKFESEPEGTICFDLIKDGTPVVRLEKNLQTSKYAATDINVKKYDFKTYLGRVVLLHGVPTGVLCVIYRDDFDPSEEDMKVLEIIASAISMEENGTAWRRICGEAKKNTASWCRTPTASS